MTTNERIQVLIDDLKEHLLLMDELDDDSIRTRIQEDINLLINMATRY